MAQVLDDYRFVVRLLRRESGNKATDHHVLWEITCDLPPPSSLSSSLSFSSAPPLTVEGVLKYLPGMAWRPLGVTLIPGGVFDEINKQHHSDESRLLAVIESWLQGGGVGGEPSWRRIIWALDHKKETRHLANTIRHFAEPLPGKSCDSITFLYSV